MKSPKIYTYEEAIEASTKYFNGNALAAKVFLNKYALKDSDQNLLELTPKDMHHRIAAEFARIEKKKFKKPLTEEEIFRYLDQFSKIIPQGSPMYGIGNTFQTISLSNCFVIPSPADAYSGIMKADEELAQIAKRRGGDGVDIATLRPAGTITHNAARTSTGTIPIMGRYSNTIREVGQNGRRGALMISTSIHHPESVIPWDDAVDGEPYMVDVPEMGKILSRWYNPNKIDFATSKYDKTKVTGANISIRVTDEFLNAVEDGTDYEQRWPVDSKKPLVSKKVSAKAVWDKIIHSAWQTAEPGVLFWDNILRESPADCYAEYGFKTISTNPCGEIPLSAFDSCRLLVLNLFGFVKNPFTKDAYFDYAEFYKVSKIAQRLMDDLVDLEEECILKILAKIEKDPESDEVKSREKQLWENILKACREGRRTGTGITALGDTLAAIGISYGSDEGINTTERIYKTLKFAAYTSSVEMAKELGPFKVWNPRLERDNPFINRIKGEEIILNGHIDGADAYSHDDKGNYSSHFSGATLVNQMNKHGRRNIALLTSAPTGTVSICAKLINNFNSSSGIEPEYDITPYTRKVKGNPGDKNFRVDSTDQNGDHFQHFEVRCAALQDWMDVTGETDYKKSPWHGSCAVELDWKQRVKLQAAAQKHVDHSISSTVNLPNDVSVEKVAEIYNTAWKAGCKGITVYRDGCRTGVLVKNDTKKASIQKSNAPKRPDTLPSDVHHIKVNGADYFVFVGLLEGDPFEVFAGKNGFIPKGVKTAQVTRMKRGEYRAKLDNGEEIASVIEHISDEEEAITRLTSTSLRHGVDIAFIVHQLEKVKGQLTGFNKALVRALKKYIKDGVEVKGEECPECKGKLIRQDGCSLCKSCGWAKCS
jgi:ribonucleoside-diphosphate reductase alpha chain